jgi:mono/diheme cytochrome c family protein
VKLFLILLGAICFIVVGVALSVWFGIYNVAATEPHWKITVWYLEKVRERSISVHSRGVTPPSLKDQKLIEIGFRHYHEMCQLCHGGPGVYPEDFAKGLNPKPPDLISEGIRRLSSAELYWIVKNGIKMTGMPAFGVTHNEEELWAMVAFVNRLPYLKPWEYEEMLETGDVHGEVETSHHNEHK